MRNKILKIHNLKQSLIDKRFVLAHGVFDLFHVGHKRHLESAKSYADFLVVSITADKYVNKGPGRPIFNSDLRSELISSLEFVDYVIINDRETPIELINQIKPNYYIKGSDYSDFKKDITGNILKEKRAVESNNGKFILSNEIEFSSSNLINNYLKPSSTISELKKNIKDLKKFKVECLKSLNQLNKLKVAVIGEIIFDEYLFSEELEKPSKENISAVQFQFKKRYLGGSFAIAKQLSKMCGNVTLFSSASLDKNQISQINKSVSECKNLDSKILKSNFKNITKSRYLNSINRKIFEVYNRKGKENFLNPERLINIMKKKIRKYDAVILCDFGHGFFSKKISNFLINNSKLISVNAQTNAGNRGFNLITKYKKANLVCIDEPELRLALKNNHDTVEKIIPELFNLINVKKILVTLGKRGIIIFEKNNKKLSSFKLTGFETNPIDTIGAGDAVFGIASLLTSIKCDKKIISFISNLIGAMTTRILGHEKTIEKYEIIKAIEYSLK